MKHSDRGFLQESCSKEIMAEHIVESCKMKHISREQNEEITRKPNIEYVKTDFKKKEYTKEYKKRYYEYKNQPKERLVVNVGRHMHLETFQLISRNAINATKRDIRQSYVENQVNEDIQILRSTGNYKFLGEINVPENKSWTKLIKIKAPGFNPTCEFKIDTGASATILPYTKKLPQLIQSNI